jgi:PAS domain S-box-containing protein
VASPEKHPAAAGWVIEHSANEIYIFDANSLLLLYCNQRARSNLGYSSQQRRLLSLSDIAPALAGKHLEKVLAQLQRHSDTRLETTLRRSDGTTYRADLLLELCTFRKRAVLAILALDLSARIRAEELVHDAQERFWQLLEFAPDAMLLVHCEGTILYANRLAWQLFGWQSGELLGRSVEILVPPLWRARHAEQRRSFAAAPQHRPMGQGLELYAVRRDGSQFPVDVSLGPIETPDGLMVAAAVRDISAVRRLEQEIAHRQRLEAIGKLAAGVAHDFNNLLSVILAASEFLIGELAVGDPRRAEVQAIQDAAQRGAALVRQLLLFARKQPHQVQTVAADELVRGMEAFLRRLAGAAASVSVELNAPGCHISVDPLQVEQIVANVAVNAVDAMPVEGNLEVRSEEVQLDQHTACRLRPIRPGRYFKLTIRDSGHGMSEEVLRRAFEPFFTTKPAGKGTGLGLATAYNLVKENNGFIWLASELGKGTTVTLYFPVVPPSEDTPLSS